MPAGVLVTGSKFALVLRNLRRTEERLDLGAYEVGVGKKAGTPLARYLRDHVDKACARLAAVAGPAAIAAVVLRAELVHPYAVFLRNDATPGQPHGDTVTE